MAPLNSTGEPNKNHFVCRFWQLSNAASKKDANMVLKCLIREVAGVQVRVPILVNSNDLSPGDELFWDKNTGKTFDKMRSMTDFGEYEKAAKRRKLG